MKKKTKRFIKIISTFLAALILIGIIPSQVFAAAADSIKNVMDISAEASAEIAAEVPEETAEAAEAEIIYEDVSKRDAYSKQFKMSDGTYQIAQYSTPVHYLDENNAWVDYDNSLTEVQNEDSENKEGLLNSFVAGLSSESKDYTNNSSDSTIKLSKKTNGKKFVSFEHDGYKISWYYENAKKQTGKISNITNDDDPSTLEKLISEVTYNNVFSKVDFQYLVSSNCVKENILLNAKSAQNEFTVQYKCNGLTAVSVDDKTVEFRNEQNVAVFTLNAPVMYDDNGASSDSITLVIAAQENGKVEIKLTADRAWLDEEGRKYPVTVDPMFQTSQEAADMDSAFVSSQNPNKCYRATTTNDSGSLYVGNIAGYGQTQSFIKFTNLPELEIGSKVVDARLNIGLVDCDVGLRVDIRRVEEQREDGTSNVWSANTVTWNNKPEVTAVILDYKEITEQTDKTKFLEFEITDTVRGWYSGEYDKDLGISLATEKTTAAKAWFCNTYFNEQNYTSNRPFLTISYRNMSGYEDYWTYTSIAAGRGGMASVNNYNGNLVYAQPLTADAGGNLMPVNISLIYNANKGNLSNHTNVGYGMQTNYHIFLKYDATTAANGYKYYLNDADGTKHWFYFENGATSGKDEDNLGYKLEEITVGSDTTEPNARYRITDKDNNKMYFNSDGYIIRIYQPVTAGSGNSVTIEYQVSGTRKRLWKITDGAGRVYTFNYGTADFYLCTSIRDPADRYTTLNYHADNNRLRELLFADSKRFELYYNGSQLKHIGSVDGTRTQITYESSAQKRVDTINWGSSDASILERYAFSYKQNETTISDRINRTYTYQFNNFGQTTGVVSNTDQSARFFEFGKGNDPKSSTANKLLSESKVLKSTTNLVKNPQFSNGIGSYATYQDNSSSAQHYRSHDAEKGNFAKGSMAFYKADNSVGKLLSTQDISVSEGSYVLSAYVSTDGATLGNVGSRLGLQLWNGSTKEKDVKAESIACTPSGTKGWERVSVQIYVHGNNKKLRLTFGLESGAVGKIWFDDIQLERSVGPNAFNMVENADVRYGSDNWNASAQVVNSNLSGYGNCLKTIGSSTNSSNSIVQYIDGADGQKGDVFSFGAWVKTYSIPTNNNTKANDAYQPKCKLALNYFNAAGTKTGSEEIEINPNVTSWQFVSGKLVASQDYSKISIEFIYAHNVNWAYMTGAFCYKENYGQTYTYDKDGNVVSAQDLAKTNSTFAYYGNQMSKMLNPSGSKYLYTYDKQNKLTYALSSDGQQYGFEYDGKGNVKGTTITARQPAVTPEANKQYILVNAYSGQALNSDEVGNSGDDAKTCRYTPNATEQHWLLEPVSGETNIYYLKSVRHSTLSLDVENGSSADGAALQIYTSNRTTAQKFKIVKSKDNTFAVLTAASGYKKAVNGQHTTKDEIVQSQVVRQSECDYNNIIGLAESMRWYFYPVDASMEEQIVSSASYRSADDNPDTIDGNFQKSFTDQRGITTHYAHDEVRGTLSSVWVGNDTGSKTNYTYDINSNLKSVSAGGMTNRYTYTDSGSISQIDVNNAVFYNFSYDRYGRTGNVFVGNGTSKQRLSSYVYDLNSGQISTQNYANGDALVYHYDSLDRLTEKSYTDKTGNTGRNKVKYYYGNDDNVSVKVDYTGNTTTKYIYDLSGRQVAQKEYGSTDISSSALKSAVRYTYADKTNYITAVENASALGTHTLRMGYGNISASEMPDRVYRVSWNGTDRIHYSYDGLGRVTNKALRATTRQGDVSVLNNHYTYLTAGNNTTTFVDTLSNAAGTYRYTYDAKNNIKTITDGSYTTSYEYDNLNQLTRVNDQRAGKTYTYTYVNGNITAKNEYAYTTSTLGEPTDTVTYSYTDAVWKDKLTSFNGESITYDAIGNPLTMGSKTFSWLGRQLLGITDGGTSISYAYNGDGQRISKTVDGVTTEFFYNGSILAGQITGGTNLFFTYDNNGDYFGFNTGGTYYYYLKNAQNDVTALVNSAGQIVARYDYDAWGVVTAVTDADGNDVSSKPNHIGNINPLRYRSYYFDTETGYYYLNSRYYSPEMCRFINTDGYVSTGQGLLSHNMFAYCLNNPVNMIDSEGTTGIVFWIVTIASVAATLIVGGWLSGSHFIENAGVALDNIGGIEDTAQEAVAEHSRNVYEFTTGANKEPEIKKNSQLNNISGLKKNYIAHVKEVSIYLKLNCDVNFAPGTTWEELSDLERRIVVTNIKLWDAWVYGHLDHEKASLMYREAVQIYDPR